MVVYFYVKNEALAGYTAGTEYSHHTSDLAGILHL